MSFLFVDAVSDKHAGKAGRVSVTNSSAHGNDSARSRTDSISLVLPGWEGEKLKELVPLYNPISHQFRLSKPKELSFPFEHRF